MGIGFIWPIVMATGVLFLRESPRWEYRKGRIESARTTIAKTYGVPETHREVRLELNEIREKFEAETAGGGQHPWYECFTGPRMLYRVLLACFLAAAQQCTGANYFFYYGKHILNCRESVQKRVYVTNCL